MFTNDGYALFIGINDYSAFDQSIGNPSGTSDLPGGCNDARMFWQICKNLGFRAEHMRVLTSPKLSPSELDGATSASVGEATEHEIREAIAWLAARVGATTRGLLTYSGHGASTDSKGLLLCPSDVSGADLDRAIPFAEIQKLVQQRNATGNLTVVLDCCYAGALHEAAARRRPQALVQRALPSSLRLAEPRLSDRVLAACAVDQLAYQARFLGQFHGAFSWAIGSTLEQWKAVEDAGGTRLDLSYGELTRRVDALYRVLSFPCAPAIYGPPGVEKLAFLQEGNAPKPTSPSPDGQRKTAQLDGGTSNWRKFTLMVGTSELAQIVIVNVNTGGFETGFEYWYVNKTTLASMGTHNVSVSHTDGSGTPTAPSYASMQTFSLVQNPIGGWGTSWTSDPLSGAGKLYENGSYALRMQTATGSGTTYVTYVAWYQVIPSRNSPANIVPDGTFTYDAGGAVSVGTGYKGYDINQSA